MSLLPDHKVVEILEPVSQHKESHREIKNCTSIGFTEETSLHNKQARMTKQCHNHRPQIYLWRHDEETHNVANNE